MESVKYRSITIRLRIWRRTDGREYWRFTRANGTRSSYPSLKVAKEHAMNEAQAIYSGTMDLSSLTPVQCRAVRRMIEADPTCGLIEEFLQWLDKRLPLKNTGEAILEFLTAKQENQGLSTENVRTLRVHLAALESIKHKNLSEISPTDLPAITGAPRTRFNVRAAWITFFRWCVQREYLPEGKTAPERLDKPLIRRKTPETYSPEQLRVLLSNVTPVYLPWLACAAFAGTRTAEICPPPGSDKSPLDWSDFHWTRGIIIIRSETAKTGQRRVIPICPALAAWLQPITHKSGRVCEALRPPGASQGNRGLTLKGTPRAATREAETVRLGKLIGGWSKNALRHSWISYRAAQVGLATTAMEGGNSESEAKRSYLDAMGADQAEEWFGVMPPKAPKPAR